MKKAVFLVSLCASLCLAVPAFALDTMNGFNLDGSILDPVDMPCKAFLAASDEMQGFVSAWWDGNSSTFVDMDNVTYNRSDVESMYEALVEGCEKAPGDTLGEIGFNYGGDEEPIGKPTCALLASRNNAQEGADLLAWTLGYVAEAHKGVVEIDIADFRNFGNEIFVQCKNNSRGNLIRLVMRYQGLDDGGADTVSSGKNIDN